MILKHIISATLTLFAVIDMIGNIPTLLSIRKEHGEIKSLNSTIISGVLMILFLAFGEHLLSLLGINVSSFALAGSLIIFAIGIEFIFNIRLFKPSDVKINNAHIFPVAFPLIAGPGTLSTILSLKSIFSVYEVGLAIIINMLIVYTILKLTKVLGDKLNDNTLDIIRKIFGIILVSIAINIFKTNI